MNDSLQQVLPISIFVLWILATIKFRFIQRGHVTEWIAITAISSHTALSYIGYSYYATVVSAVFMVCILYHSVHNTDKELYSVSIFLKVYRKICGWLHK